MNYDEYLFVSSEIRELESLLQAIPKGNVISRVGLESRLKAAKEAIAGFNIKETEETYTGEFQGVLPKGRTFEFKLRDQEGILKGKVGPEIEDADILNRNYLHKLVNVKFHVLQVGQGRPRFTLEKLEGIASTA